MFQPCFHPGRLRTLALALVLALASPALAQSGATTNASASQAAAGTNTLHFSISGQTLGLPTVTNVPVSPEAEAEFRRLLEQDNTAQEEADRLLRLNSHWATDGTQMTDDELQLRVRAKFIAVRSNYETFLARNPRHVGALLAYGSLLDDLGEDNEALQQWEKARTLAPENPAVWNNLANYYAANDNEVRAFTYYEKAIALATNAAPYKRNLGSAIIHCRTNAMSYYAIGEQGVLLKGLRLLRESERELRDDFSLATEIGQVLYAIQPLRGEELLAAWNHALELAGDDIEREGVRLHLARVNLLLGNPGAARALLLTVTNAPFAHLRRQLETQLAAKPAPPRTNAPGVLLKP